MSDADNTADGRRDLFNALAHPLRERIRSGALAPGALVPSESQLAQAAGATRYSIRKALTRLHGEGLIAPVQGLGWVVVDPAAQASPDIRQLLTYGRIAESLRAEITAGRLASGDALPSESALVAQWDVARATVRQALGVLESEGLIRARPGSGRYVR